MVRTLGLMVVSLCGLGAATTASAAPTGGDNMPTSEWRLIGGNPDVWYYSPLHQINDHNVKQLGLAWMADIPSKDGLVGNPLVADGVVYQSGPLGRIYANDVRTGKLLWRFAPAEKFDETMSPAAFWSSRINRGVALLDNNVYVASGDCRLFAVDRRTGKEAWHVQPCDSKKNYGITQAPRVGGGKVFIGNNSLDSGLERGYVDAFDAKTGKHLWRFYTMPGDPSKPFESKVMEMASKTWGTGYWKRTHGAVSPYEAMTFDGTLGLLYIGTGSGAPWSPAERAPDAGDELFADSIVAVNASTGEYVWHYQTVQHDGWDFDATWQITVADLPIKGTTRRVVMTAPKNGFFYVLDAKTGRFLSANNYLPVNWASRIDPETGRPVTTPEVRYWERPNQKKTVLSPGPLGAHSWQAMAFNPSTRLIYLPAIIGPTLMEPNPDVLLGGIHIDEYYGLGSDPNWKSGGQLIAWDPITQSARWRVKRELPINGGTLTTAGNLVFQGTAVGTFDAFAADTGELLWSFNVQGSVEAAPTSVEIDGQQIILLASGNSASSGVGSYIPQLTSIRPSQSPSRLLAFELGGTGTVPKTFVPEFPKPPLPRQPVQLAKKGGVYFEAESCDLCHGFRVGSAGGSAPDLRMSSALGYAEMSTIVLGGSRRDRGMPPSPKMPAEELKAIQAYVLNEAWGAYEAQQASKSHSSQDSR